MLGRIERAFESFLWKSPLLVLSAVIASLLVSLAMFYVTTVDVDALLRESAGYASLDPGVAHGDVRAQIVARIALQPWSL